MEADQTAAVTGVSREDSSWMTRCLTGGAHLSAAAQRTISGVGASWAWAGFSAWAETAPPALSLFFSSKYFSFSVFEIKSFVLQQNLQRFESLQICYNFKKGQRFWVKYNVE
jgi:hypothetical protein